MSIGETGSSGPCPECAHSAAKCSTCGGYDGYPDPPNNITKGPCLRCVGSIGAPSQPGPTALPPLYGVPQQAIDPDAIQTPKAPPSVS